MRNIGFTDSISDFFMKNEIQIREVHFVMFNPVFGLALLAKLT